MAVRLDALDRLAVPVIAAPMAGGASTPELVAAVNGAGGLGFLAAGYRSAAAMLEQIHRVRETTDRPFGVNLFVPAEPGDPAAVAAYRDRLRPEAERHGVTLPETIAPDRDDWDAKIAALLAGPAPVPVVSYTFGLPSAEEARALRDAGSFQVGTVTTPKEARRAEAVGMDALCVQGPEAGGHRATHRVADRPGDQPLLELLAGVRAVTGLPLIAAGGLADGPAVAGALRAGAVAVQLGTALLCADESGASAAHRSALAEFEETVVTRSFTGRPARGLRNAFIDRYEPYAPAAYPEVHHLTQPLRVAATRRGDTAAMHLWAGTGHRAARGGPAAELVKELWERARAAGR
ncbi:NAD(P)H-dependent flavin oxidoreductase [Streptomyces sp. BE303]|uniref:NAD(P)H-dependent flavin oxidoreductase n=1 Tax=Streptomyces sp. BE303 TaxID=3002528 RepID=UPI002E799402|nr:nitronate monooxygenase [Streptomyces sp. BE303]MED7950773.1 nitronate monooxygenase [Streptomyces sp. BE303]